MHGIIFLLDIAALLFFILTFIKQLSLQHEYKNHNGLRYHRLAYMVITFSMILMIFSRMIMTLCGENGYYSIDYLSLFDYILLVFIKVWLTVASITTWLWFKGSKFKFLKIFDKFI